MLPTSVPHILTIYDLVLTPIYFFIFLYIIKRWKHRYYTNTLYKKYIFPAVILRMLGGVFLASLYNFYYAYGDTFGYYTGALEIWDAFLKSPKLAFQILTQNTESYSLDIQGLAPNMSYTGSGNSIHIMSKIAGSVGLFCFGTYLPIALFFSLLSFWGTWLIYLVLVKEYPHLYKVLAITTLFIPSVLVWSNGIMKEPLCMFALGLCFYSFYHTLKKEKISRNIVFFTLGAFILLNIKDYIFYSFITGAILWSYSIFTRNIRSSFLRLFVKGIIILTFAVSAVLVINSTDFINEKIVSTFSNAENLQNTMKIVNENSGGSSYTIPSAGDLSSGGLMTSFFLSVNVSLFRPYLWECKNVFMLMNFFESFITTILVILLFFKAGFRKIFFYTRHSPVLLFSIAFSTLMAVMAGFISFNFGTLIRYKTPFLPFFFSYIIIILYDKTATRKKISL